MEEVRVGRNGSGRTQTNTLALRTRSLVVVTDYEDDEIADCEDVFALSGSDGRSHHERELTVKYACEKIEGQPCLRFDFMDPEARYTLKVRRPDGQEAVVCEDVPFEELSAVSDNLDATSEEP